MARATTARFEFRLRPEVKERIEYAAQLVRIPVGDFVRTAAEDRADEVIRVQAATVMPADFFDAVLAALDDPPRPNAALARSGASQQGQPPQAGPIGRPGSKEQ